MSTIRDHGLFFERMGSDWTVGFMPVPPTWVPIRVIGLGLKPVKLLGLMPKARSWVATSGPGCIPCMGQAQVVQDRIITSNIPK